MSRNTTDMHFQPFNHLLTTYKASRQLRRLAKLFALVALLIYTPKGYSQKHYITNQYVYDLYLMNPAAAAFYKDCFIANAYVQKQWFGTDGSPSTQILSAQAALNENLGSGTYIYNDQNGNFKEMGLQQTFSYEVLVSENSRSKGFTKLRFGVSLDLERSSLSYNDLSAGSQLDPAIVGGNESGWGFNANTGVILLINRFHTGFSLTNLISQPNTMFESELEPKTPLDMHFYAGSTFKVSDIELFIEPMIYYRRNTNVESRMDVNVKLTMPTLDDNLSFWGLLAYRRTMDKDAGVDLASAVTMGAVYRRINLGLEYQFGLTSAQQNYGSYFQLILGYRFCRDRFKGAIECPGEKKGKRVNEKYISY